MFAKYVHLYLVIAGGLALGALLALSAHADAPPDQGSGKSTVAEPAAPPSEPTQAGILRVGPFSLSDGVLPPGWEPLEFEGIQRHTRYTVARNEDGGAWVVRARSKAAASGLIRRIEIDLAEHPVVRWRWRIENLIEGSDPTRRSGDDYPARLYIAFRYEPDQVGFLRRATYLAARAAFGDLPFGAITYIWTNDTPVGSIVDNAYAGSFVKMIAVESGSERVGRWVTEQRNVYEDYHRAFGAEPPDVEGVAIMTDTDDTGGQASAAYGDILFLTREAAARNPVDGTPLPDAGRRLGPGSEGEVEGPTSPPGSE